MSLALVLLLGTIQAGQTNGQKVQPPVRSGSPAQTDTKLHTDVQTLLELTDARKRVQDSFPQSLEDGKKQMMEHCPTCSAEFAEEWKKRMEQRMDAAPFLAATAEVYEKFLTDADVFQLIELQRASNRGAQISIPEELKTKLSSVMPTLLSEVVGRCTQIGAKLGAEVATEIEKENPEYIHPTPKPVAP